MVKLNAKNGTPVGNAHLCKSCNWGQIMTGYRESDQLVICTSTSPNIAVPFAMLECSGYDDKFKPTYKQMEKLAIEIDPARKSSRTPGFSIVTTVRPVCPNEEDQDETASARLVPARREIALRDALDQSQPHSGTYLGKAIQQVDAASQKGYDRLVVITDEQSHDRVPAPSGKGYVINVASNRNGVGYGPWTHIDGWSEAVVEYIAELESAACNLFD